MGETILITGGNRGLGFETAQALATDAKRTIILAGRDCTTTGEAAKKIMAATGNKQIVPMQLDLAQLKSVRNFVTAFQALDYPPLTALVCNAAVSKTTVKDKSAEGYEQTFAINHLGHFLLVHLLLAQLAPSARIVVVSSGVHNAANAAGPMLPPRYTRPEWMAYPERDPNLPADDVKAGQQAYSTSKLCNMLFVVELARQLEAAGHERVTVNGFDPGLMAGTGLGRDGKPLTRFIWYYVLPLLRPFMGEMARTAQQSGKDLAYLVTAPELDGVTAVYFAGQKQTPYSVEVDEATNAAELWAESVRLTALHPKERILPMKKVM